MWMATSFAVIPDRSRSALVHSLDTRSKTSTMAVRHQIRLCVLSTQRSGSSWLMDLINNCRPEVRVYGELYNDRPAKSANPHATMWGHLVPPTRYYDWRVKHGNRRPWNTFRYLRMIQTEASTYKYFGFKLMYNQLYKKPELLLCLLWERYRIIHLVRENLLDLAVSRAIMHATGRSHTSDGDLETVQVILDPEDLLYQVERIHRRINQIRRALRWLPLPSMEISYEELFRDTSQAMERVAVFLGIPTKDVRIESIFRRANRGSWRDKVSNCAEVEDALRKTAFAGLISDPTQSDLASPTASEIDG